MDDQDRMTVRRFIFGAVVVILIIVLLWFIFFRNKDKKTATQNTGTSTSQGQTSSPEKGTTNPGGGSSTPPQTQSAQTQAVQQKSGQLANVGPGETTTIFGAATIAGAVAHHLYRRRLQVVSLINGQQ